MRWRLTVLGILLTSVALAQESDRAADEKLLRDQNLPTQGPDLLQIIRDRTPSSEMILQFKKQLPRLQAAAYSERMRGTAELTKLGPKVRPLAANLLLDGKADAETVARLREVLEKFPGEKDETAAAAAARLIARDPPKDSLEVLLAFVPYATSESVRRDIQQTINVIGVADKKPAAVLLESLNSAEPARRAAAAEALIRLTSPSKEQLATLLADEHPLVRFQVGMALAEKHDKRGLPLLIAALSGSPGERVEQALELLAKAAGEDAPEVYYLGKHNAAELTTAWKKWHDRHGDKLDLGKALTRTELGYTLISTTGLNINVKNKIFELGPGPERAVRWEFDGPRNPLDVQIIGPNRLLVVEYFDRRITERDFKGNVLKQFPAQLPIGCQRLPNGRTLIVTRQLLRIIDADGRDVFTFFPPTPTIAAATRLSNGHIAMVMSGGKCMLLNAQGQELKSFTMGGNIYTLGGNIEILPNGRILAPLYTSNTIVEFDWSGTKHWQASINRPTSVSRLANGNTLVTCTFDSRVVEIDRNGAEVWSYHTEGRPYRARRR